MIDILFIAGFMAVFLLIDFFLQAMSLWGTVIIGMKIAKLRVRSSSLWNAVKVTLLSLLGAIPYLALIPVFSAFEGPGSDQEMWIFLFIMCFMMIYAILLSVYYVWLIRRFYRLKWLKALLVYLAQQVVGGAVAIVIFFSVALVVILFELIS